MANTLYYSLHWVLPNGRLSPPSSRLQTLPIERERVSQTELNEGYRDTFREIGQNLTAGLDFSGDEYEMVAFTSKTRLGPIPRDALLVDVLDGRYGEVTPAQPLGIFLFGAWSFDEILAHDALRRKLTRIANPDPEAFQAFLAAFDALNDTADSDMVEAASTAEEPVRLPSFQESFNDPVILIEEAAEAPPPPYTAMSQTEPTPTPFPTSTPTPPPTTPTLTPNPAPSVREPPPPIIEIPAELVEYSEDITEVPEEIVDVLDEAAEDLLAPISSESTESNTASVSASELNIHHRVSVYGRVDWARFPSVMTIYNPFAPPLRKTVTVHARVSESYFNPVGVELPGAFPIRS